MSDILKENEAYYYKVKMPKILQAISVFKTEAGTWGKCRRLEYLYDKLIDLDRELIERYTAYNKSFEYGRPYIERAFIALYIPEIKEEISKLEREIDFIVKAAQQGAQQGAQQWRNGITPEMIEQARCYPIGNLVNVKRGIALCPFHNDHKPSMGVKNNRYHCFACGEKGDVIELLRKRDGLSFGDAVRQLA